MTHDVARGPGSVGRHRSPWGRPGRILPIRWGRIIAVVVTLAVAVASLVAIRVRTSSEGRAAGPGGSQGAPAAPLAPTPGGEQSDVLTATVVSPRPGVSPVTPTAPALPPGVGVTATAGPPGAAGVGGGTRPAGPSRASTVPVAPRPPGAVLGLSSTAIDMGEVDSVWRVDLTAEGTAPVDVVIGASPAWLSVVPNQQRVDPGHPVPLVFTLDRAAAPPGPVDVTVPISARGGRGGGNVRVEADVSGPPQIVSVTAAPAPLYPAGCPPVNGAAVATVTVSVVDLTGIFGVELAATFPDGKVGRVSLSLDNATGNRSTWSGPLGPAGGAGTVSYTTTATDLDGRHSDAQGSLAVLACPT